MLNQKVIHYCWFGRNSKSKLIKRCIKSWHKFCPDYEIKEWNEDNYDVQSCAYTKEAYESKKWAFVSDYARFDILNREGGVYLDVDVELLKSLDPFVEKGNFTAFEWENSVNTGLVMSCQPNDPLCQAMLAEYRQEHFLVDGKENLRTVCVRVTDILKAEGLVAQEDRTQEVMGYTVYDSRYFNPFNPDTGKIELSPETVAIHRYAGSWLSRKARFRGKVYRFLCRVFGKKFAEKTRKRFGKKA